MSLTVISASQVRELLPMSDCVDVMDKAMRAVSAGTAGIPQRLIEHLPDGSGFFGLMPGTISDPAVYGAKIVSLHPANPSQGRPAVQGFVTLFEHATGTPIAVIEGGEITAIRTAAASGLATRELARADAKTLGIFGNGVQARVHIDAVAAVRDVEKVIVSGRDFDRASAFAAEQAERTGLDVVATANPEKAGGCDVVCTTTISPEPILMGEWVKPGAHLNLVGAHSLTTREADTAAVAKSLIYYDYLPSLKNEGGDVMIPIEEGAIAESDLMGEIGALLNGDIEGRTNDEQVTLYNSMGVVAQDLFSAEYILSAAQENGIGSSVDLDS